MAYANGKFPKSATVALTTAPGQRLEPTAARQWDALARSVQNTHGWLPVLTDSYRPYDVQERIFRDRYRQGNHRGKAGFTTDVRYWGGQPWTRRSGTAAAAVPGTSNHGWAKAVDVSGLGGFNGTRFKQLAALAARFGYSNAEGRSVNEPWHWVFTGSYSVSKPIGGTGSVTNPTIPGAPAPITPEEDMPLTDADVKKVADEVLTRRVTLADGNYLTVGQAIQSMVRALEGAAFRTNVHNAVWVNPQWTVPGTDRKENPGQFLSAARVASVQAVHAAGKAAGISEDDIKRLVDALPTLTAEDVASQLTIGVKEN